MLSKIKNFLFSAFVKKPSPPGEILGEWCVVFFEKEITRRLVFRSFKFYSEMEKINPEGAAYEKHAFEFLKNKNHIQQIHDQMICYDLQEYFEVDKDDLSMACFLDLEEPDDALMFDRINECLNKKC